MPVLFGGVRSNIPFASVSTVCHHWAESFPAYSMYVVRLKNTALHGGLQGAPVSAPVNEMLSAAEAWRHRGSRRRWKNADNEIAMTLGFDTNAVIIVDWGYGAFIRLGWKGKAQLFCRNNQI